MPPGGSESDRVAVAEDGNDLAEDILVGERGVVP
jgi:hypothetical protein